MTPTQRHKPLFILCLALAWVAAAPFSGSALRAEETSATRAFDIPAGDGADTFRQFISQSGEQLLYSADSINGVRTQAVKGQYSARDALDQMVAGTELTVVKDKENGALTLVRAASPKAPGATPSMEASSRPDSSNQTIVLDPFQVGAEADKGYSTLNSNSITAFGIALNHAPVTADIMDEEFLKDTGVLTVEQALQLYDASSFYQAGNVTNAAQNQPGDRVASPTMKVRGQNVNGIQTDGIQINAGNYGQTNFGTTSLYDVERVEVIDGPQSLIFGGGGAGAVVNLVTKAAILGRPAFGELSYLVDQYGSKQASVDFGAGNSNFALRFTATDQSNSTRRVNMGDTLVGQYLQLAARFWNTTLKLTLQQSLDNRISPDYVTLTSAGDPIWATYNNWHLETLLATNHAAGLVNGNASWNTVESYIGAQNMDSDVSESAIIDVTSAWTKWLTTDLTVADANFDDDQNGAGTINFFSPGATANTLPGNWTVSEPTSGPPLSDNWRAHDSKAIRFTVLMTNTFMNGTAKSQTSMDADYTRSRNDITGYSYYQADANWNIIVNHASTANLGRTTIPTLAWSVNNGPILYALPNFLTGVKPKNLASDRLTINGVNYLRANTTVYDPTINSGNLGISTFAQSGGAAVNYTQWADGKLDTMAGIRYTHAWSSSPSELYKPSFSAGLDYHLTNWMAPYIEWSSIWATQGQGTTEPNGAIEPPAHAVSEEFGVKFDPPDTRISGSLSGYINSNHDQNVSVPNISGDVSPNGLNGQVPQGTGNNQPANVHSEGITAALTANPSDHWRMRLSAAWTYGKYVSGVQYNQNYNDQFHEDSAGDVTYGDGTIVYVPGTYNSKQLTVPQGTAGAVPLTVTLLSTPGGQYFAAPAVVTGAISKTSNGGLVLLNGASATAGTVGHGTILTGATGLPMTDYQLKPSLSGVVPFGVIYAANVGSQTQGYPEYSFNYTTVYTIPSSWAKGLYFGGTASANWKQLSVNYNPSATQVDPSNNLTFFLPTQWRFDLITGYTRKLKRVTWTTKLNVNNVFNQYKVLLFPTTTTGFTTASSISANFNQPPRYYSWTNTIRF